MPEAAAAPGRFWAVFNRIDVFADRDPKHKEDAFLFASRASPSVHCSWFVVYAALMGLYTSFACASFVVRPEIEEFSFAPMTGVPPPRLGIEIECSSRWACHAGTPGAWSSSVTVAAAFASASGCDSSTVIVPGPGNPWMRYSANLSLCGSVGADDGIEISVSTFGAVCAYGEVGCNVWLRVTLRALESAQPMELVVDLEQSQRKAVYIGSLVKRQADSHWLPSLAPKLPGGAPTRTLSSEPYVGDLFYEGKNVASRSRLRIRTKQFAELITTSRPGTPLTVLGEVGGANGSPPPRVRNFERPRDPRNALAPRAPMSASSSALARRPHHRRPRIAGDAHHVAHREARQEAREPAQADGGAEVEADRRCRGGGSRCWARSIVVKCGRLTYITKILSLRSSL